MIHAVDIAVLGFSCAITGGLMGRLLSDFMRREAHEERRSFTPPPARADAAHGTQGEPAAGGAPHETRRITRIEKTAHFSSWKVKR